MRLFPAHRDGRLDNINEKTRKTWQKCTKIEWQNHVSIQNVRKPLAIFRKKGYGIHIR